MGEQELYKRMLKKLIVETENQQIKSAEELIQKIVKELTNNQQLSGNTQM
ncbi:hypothetical protein NSA56_02980 [Oceanobacillus caeni]|nr:MULTISPECIES: hypothetical protein [Bacillaceae]MBU8790323.1 hypothetical protein [Oceanobacillus caeni]MCR1833359.1 hypothetical protein [Oceanobacillus caeni]MED4474722.1 hypothetical protein [Oceanobacillus caeni]